MRLDCGRPTSDHFMASVEGVEFKNSQGKTMCDVVKELGLERGATEGLSSNLATY